ncbi:hypothetical protein CsSME_00048142 [Camellia sinensis var. sinensis]
MKSVPSLTRGSHKRSVVIRLERYEFKGYVFKIMGGCDKQGFPMKQGVLTPGRVCLLLHRVGLEILLSKSNDSCIQMQHLLYQDDFKSCLFGQALHVFVVMEGAKETGGGNLFGNSENDLPGLTDVEKPRMRGTKRASKSRKLFNLSKEDDVRKYVNRYRRTFTTKSGKKCSKAPKIQ